MCPASMLISLHICVNPILTARRLLFISEMDLELVKEVMHRALVFRQTRLEALDFSSGCAASDKELSIFKVPTINTNKYKYTCLQNALFLKETIF